MDTPDLAELPEHLQLLAAILRLRRGQSLPCWADPDLWFSRDPFDQLSARAGCQRCPVRAECYAAAAAAGERHGIWGGESFPVDASTNHVMNSHTVAKC